VPSPIFAGAEPFSAAGGPVGVLVLHGFTGSPQSMRPLAKAFAAAGFTVELPLLPGHGTSVQDMIPTGWADWTAAADEAYAGLAGRCDHVFAAGLSMGGSLAIWLGERHPGIAGLVLVNPLVAPAAQSFRDMLSAMIDQGLSVTPAIASDIAMPGSPESGYGATPIAGLRCPVLLLSSRNDHVVPSESGDLLAAGAGGSVERVWLERSFHVATLDYDAAEIEARAVEFVTKLGALR
jgi:carboxylesterase